MSASIIKNLLRLSTSIEGSRMMTMIITWWAALLVSTKVTTPHHVIVGSGKNSPWPNVGTLKDLRWIELTAVQYFVGGVISLGVFKVFWNKSLFTNKRSILLTTVVHVTGTLVLNALYSQETFSAQALLLKVCEPLLTLCMIYKHSKPQAKPLTLIWYVVVMMIAASIVGLYELSPITIWSLVLSIIPSIVFPLCHVLIKLGMLKADSHHIGTPLQRYAVISIYSTLLLLPLLLVRYLMKKRTFFAENSLKGFLVSAVSHFTYNFASLSVLQQTSLVSHSIFNVAENVLVNVACSSVSVFSSTHKLFGLILFCSTVLLYFTRNQTTVKVKTISYTLLCLAIGSVLLTHQILRDDPPSIRLTQTQHLASQITLSKPQIMFTAWVYNAPMPKHILDNIQALQVRNPSTHLHVYCGNSQCVYDITHLRNNHITSQFLIATNLVNGTPLRKWMARHPLHKVLVGMEFENHLQEAVKLGISWHYGGVFIDPTLKLDEGFTFPNLDHSWILQGDQTSGRHSNLVVWCVPKQHDPFIGELAEKFVSEYHIKDKRFMFDFSRIVEETRLNICPNYPKNCPSLYTHKFMKLSTADSQSYTYHFGALFGNDARPYPTNTEEEMEMYTEIQFLPFVDHKVKPLSITDRSTVFINGRWKTTNTDDFKMISQPLLLSLHIERNFLSKTEQEFFLINGPIGCLDSSTVKLLREHDVESFLSGSMALLMKNPNVDIVRSDVYLVDIESDIRRIIPLAIRKKGLTVETDTTLASTTNKDRLIQAYENIEKYASARVVVTQDVNCALVCVAMGTPVVFINTPTLLRSERITYDSTFYKLTSLFHTIDLNNVTNEEAKEWLGKFPWDNPPPNPNAALMMRLRASLWNVIRNNQQLYDASYKFGIVPMSLPPVTKPATEDPLLFHFLFTTSEKSSFKLYDREIYVSGQFNWRHFRSVESIFHHHPLAKVIIHSNTLDLSEFDMLTEAGYDIEIQGYNIEEMLKDSPASTFSEKLVDARKSVHWYSHETDLIRMLVLYESGGVYMDTDMVLVRPIDTLVNNVLALQDHLSLNGAFMRFIKHNPYIKDCLEEFAVNYDGTKWPENGPFLLTRIWKKWGNSSEHLHVVKRNTFYMFRSDHVDPFCFRKTSKELFDANMEILKNEAYSVHLNSKMTGNLGLTTDTLQEGTVCKHLLNSYCVLCNKYY